VVLGTEVTAECALLQPVSLDVKLTRNLSSTWYHGHPDVEFHARLHDFSVRLGFADFVNVVLVADFCYHTIAHGYLNGYYWPKFKNILASRLVSCICLSVPALLLAIQ